jgi:uncharacterized protein YbjT (DUF2867 family)
VTDGQTILVTGATGNVGFETTRVLLQQGCAVRALVRRPDRARELFRGVGEGAPRVVAGDTPADRRDGGRTAGAAARLQSGLELRSFDFCADTADPGLFEGVRRLLLVRPPAVGDVRRYMFPFLRTAREAGVEQVVLLSLLGAERMFFVPHRKLEKEIQRLGFAHHFLRAGFFMQNLDTVFAEFIRDADELPVPAGRGRTSFVDSRDIGEAAAKLLLSYSPEPAARQWRHAQESGRAAAEAPAVSAASSYELTGSEALSYAEVAEVLSRELGRDIVYTQPSLRRFRKRALAAGWAPGYTRVVGRLFYTVRFGMAARVTDDLARILERAPRQLSEYARDYRGAWQRSVER